MNEKTIIKRYSVKTSGKEVFEIEIMRKAVFWMIRSIMIFDERQLETIMISELQMANPPKTG